jgi:hypothetical protein
MYKLNPVNGDIQLEDGDVLSPPYEDPRYQDYAAWIQAGNTPEEFIPPEVIVVPNKVTRFQARAALHLAGLLPMIEGYMQLETTSVMERLAWNDALEFERNSPLINALCGGFGLTAEQVDNLFIQASQIKA